MQAQEFDERQGGSTARTTKLEKIESIQTRTGRNDGRLAAPRVQLFETSLEADDAGQLQLSTGQEKPNDDLTPPHLQLLTPASRPRTPASLRVSAYQAKKDGD